MWTRHWDFKQNFILEKSGKRISGFRGQAVTPHRAAEMRQFQIVTSLAGILSPRPQRCDLGGSVLWQGDDQVALRTWSQRCHSLFTKLVFRACAGTLVAQVPEAVSPQHQLVLAGRGRPDFDCQQSWGCCPPPWVCRGEGNWIGTCPSCGRRASIPHVRVQGAELCPPVCGVHPSDLSQGLIAPLSATWGSLP